MYPGDWNCKGDKESVNCNNGTFMSTASVFYNLSFVSPESKIDKDTFASRMPPLSNQPGEIEEIEVGGAPAWRKCDYMYAAETGVCVVLAGKEEKILITYSGMPWEENQSLFDGMLSMVHFVSSDNQSDRMTPSVVTGFDPSVLFPMTVGAEWTYQIEIGDVDPLYYREIYWGGGAVYRNKGFFPGFIKDKASKTFTLKMKIVDSAEDSESVYVNIEEDNLGIFEGAQMVFWVKNGYSTEGILADQVIVEGVSYPKSLGPDNGNDDGYSTRISFFLADNGTRLAVPQDNPFDSLTIIDIVTDIPEYIGIPLTHFRRVVAPDPEESSAVGKGFTEDTWFMEGKGLVRLEQKVEGKTSMVWTLIQFSDGKP
jgi:hypothetical protein